MALRINNEPRKTLRWKDAVSMTLYRSPANDLLVMALPQGKAVALRVTGCTSSKPGEVWAPGSESIWVEVIAELIISGDV